MNPTLAQRIRESTNLHCHNVNPHIVTTTKLRCHNVNFLQREIVARMFISERDTTHSIVAIQVKFSQNESMVEIYCKGLVRDFGKVILMKSS